MMRMDNHGGIHGKEHTREIAGVRLECVFAIEDGDAFMVGTPGSEEDIAG